MKAENYKGYTLHIQQPVLNPNGQKTQSVLIYKGSDFVGGAYAVCGLEDAVQKAKAKVDGYAK